jgi:PAS domain S-box-containing protein
VRQVRNLVGATRALAAGDLGARSGMEYSGGELGQLARAFDEMAESLQWRMAQLRESENERSYSQDRFSALADMAPEAILGMDEDFSLFFCNHGAERLLGRGRGDLEGCRLDALVQQDRGGRGYDELVGALRDPGRDRVQAILLRGDGSPFRADLTVSRSQRHGRTNYALILRERGT